MSSEQRTLLDVEADAAGLTDAEREVWTKVNRYNVGPREIARRTDRSPGTVGNLLRRAREKLGEGSQ